MDVDNVESFIESSLNLDLRIVGTNSYKCELNDFTKRYCQCLCVGSSSINISFEGSLTADFIGDDNNGDVFCSFIRDDNERTDIISLNGDSLSDEDSLNVNFEGLGNCYGIQCLCPVCLVDMDYNFTETDCGNAYGIFAYNTDDAVYVEIENSKIDVDMNEILNANTQDVSAVYVCGELRIKDNSQIDIDFDFGNQYYITHGGICCADFEVSDSTINITADNTPNDYNFVLLQTYDINSDNDITDSVINCLSQDSISTEIRGNLNLNGSSVFNALTSKGKYGMNMYSCCEVYISADSELTCGGACSMRMNGLNFIFDKGAVFNAIGTYKIFESNDFSWNLDDYDIEDSVVFLSGDTDITSYEADPIAYSSNIYDKVTFSSEDEVKYNSFNKPSVVRIDFHEHTYECDSLECSMCGCKRASAPGHTDVDKDSVCDTCKHIFAINTELKAPVATETLPTTADTDIKYVTADVIWDPADTSAAYSVSYSAKIELVPDAGYSFDKTCEFTINGDKAEPTVSDDGTVTLSVTFEKTAEAPTPTPDPTPEPTPDPIPSGVPTPTPELTPANEPTPTPTEAPAPEENPTSFIERCYTVALGREAEEEGLDYWVDNLNNGQACGAQVGFGFIFSAEYQNRERSNEEFVNDLYAMYFGREADEAGFAYWINALENGSSREEVFAGFANSEEFYNLCTSYGVTAGCYVPGMDLQAQGGVNCFVARLYKVCLNRLPDMAGQNGWTMQLINGEVTGSTVAFGFVFGPEFIALNLDNTDYVKYMYRAFFGREADEEGLVYWVDMLETGTASREDVFSGFTGSAEFVNLCASYGINA